MVSVRTFTEKLQDDLEFVKSRGADFNEMKVNLDRYVQWHHDNPELAGPLVMFIHEETIAEGE